MAKIEELSRKDKAAIVVGIAITFGLGLLLGARFGMMLQKAKEAELKGNMGEIKAALSLYYGDHGGQWPDNLQQLIPEYLEEIPVASPVTAVGEPSTSGSTH